jgi:hypothetical protein
VECQRGNNVAFGRRAYGGGHAEREPNHFDDPDSYQHYDDLRGQLDGLLVRLCDRISQADLALLVEFLDAGEYGLTLEQLADVLSEGSTPITPDERTDMLALNQQMSLEPRVPHAIDHSPTAESAPGE